MIFNRIFENFVILELIKQASWNSSTYNFEHYRTTSGGEVDLIIERSIGSKFTKGILIYLGKEMIPFGKNLFAVPVASLW